MDLIFTNRDIGKGGEREGGRYVIGLPNRWIKDQLGVRPVQRHKIHPFLLEHDPGHIKLKWLKYFITGATWNLRLPELPIFVVKCYFWFAPSRKKNMIVSSTRKSKGKFCTKNNFFGRSNFFTRLICQGLQQKLILELLLI